jgi:hypothetical protein
MDMAPSRAIDRSSDASDTSGQGPVIMLDDKLYCALSADCILFRRNEIYMTANHGEIAPGCFYCWIQVIKDYIIYLLIYCMDSLKFYSLTF